MTKAMEGHIFYMREALAEARKAAALGEVPVGALLVDNQKGAVIARGHNRRETERSAGAHAEMLVIEEGCRRLGDWRLGGCTLYVTLEPCPMCAGALINSRVDSVVFGAFDPLAGCCGSVINLFEVGLPHRPAILAGVLQEECETLLRDFFAALRPKEV